jgi:hypothetical protein
MEKDSPDYGMDQIYISSDEEVGSDQEMQCSDEEAGSTRGFHGEVGIHQILVGMLGLRAPSPVSLAGLSPNHLGLMHVARPDSDSASDSDIYVPEANDDIPLAVYISHSESEGEEDEEEDVMMETDPDIYIPLPTQFGSDPNPHYNDGNSAAMDGRVPGIETEEVSVSASNHFSGRYTADSFAHFQEEWLE